MVSAVITKYFAYNFILSVAYITAIYYTIIAMFCQSDIPQFYSGINKTEIFISLASID
jgi:hypothetical protein